MSDRAKDDGYEFDRHRYKSSRSGRSRSRSPRRKHRDHADSRDWGRDADRDRYSDVLNSKYRVESSGSGNSRRTRWDVGEPANERGRKEKRIPMRSGSETRSRSASIERRYRNRRHKEVSPPNGYHKKTMDKSSRRRGSCSPSRHSRSSSSESRASDSSDSYHRSRHKKRPHRRHHRSFSSSSSRSGSRERERERHHRKSKDADGRKKRRDRHKTDKRKRKRSRSPDEKRSILTGKKIKMKVHKSEEDHERDANREKLLHFLNSTFE